MQLFLDTLFIHLALVIISWVLIYKSKIYDRTQKRWQATFSFLLPVLGPMTTILVYWGDKLKIEKPTGRYMGQSIDEVPFYKYFKF